MNKILSQLGDLSWGKVLVIGLVLAGLYYVLLFDDGTELRQQIELADAGLKQSEIDLKKVKKELDDANKFEREVLATTREFNRIVQFMPSDMGVAHLNEIVTKQVSLSGLRATRIDPEQKVDKQPYYQAFRVKIQLEGTFAQVLSFLSNISRVPKLLTVENVMLKSLGSEGSKLEFAASVVGYKYVREAVASAPKEEAPAGEANAGE